MPKRLRSIRNSTAYEITAPFTMAVIEGHTVDEKPGSPEMSEPREELPIHDVAAETRVCRKLDFHMMPLFFVLCKSHLERGLPTACVCDAVGWKLMTCSSR